MHPLGPVVDGTGARIHLKQRPLQRNGQFFSLLLVFMTPLYLYTAMGVRSAGQLVISTLSMIVWIYALGQGPVKYLKAPLYEAWYGSVALAIWTLIPPMLLYHRKNPAQIPG